MMWASWMRRWASRNTVHLAPWSPHVPGDYEESEPNGLRVCVSAGLPSGVRISDHISLGVIARTFPLQDVRQVLTQSGRGGERECDLPTHCDGLLRHRACPLYGVERTQSAAWLLDGLRSVWGPAVVKVVGKSALPQARRRLGKSPCDSCMNGWCTRSRRAPRRALGIATGGWSVWTAPP
jgi:hypothetical protein